MLSVFSHIYDYVPFSLQIIKDNTELINELDRQLQALKKDKVCIPMDCLVVCI